MNWSIDAVLRYARTLRPRAVSELRDFLRFPSVSSDPNRRGDVQTCAAWLAGHLRGMGLQNVHLIETGGAPLVCGSRLLPGQPTLMIYGHYDVQPAEPLGAWRSPPFGPIVRGQDLYARGASDDKGQLFAHIKALECWWRTNGTAPVGIRCLFEGEEEIGSTHFRSALQKNRERLRCDVAVISDTRMLGLNRPAITCALRGSLNVEVEVIGPDRDLHSGTFGGAAPNPIHALSSIIASLHDREGRVAAPDFYRRVLGCWPEPGSGVYERTTSWPALTVTGIRGGHQGPGVKGIVPHSALAKINVRLVPNQNPTQIDDLLRRHIIQVTPPRVRSRVRTISMAAPVVTPTDHPFVRAAARAYTRAFGTSPVLMRSGGTIPVVNAIREVLGIPTVLMGFALPDDGAHGPNEKIHLPTFFRAIETSIFFMHELRRARRTAEAA